MPEHPERLSLDLTYGTIAALFEAGPAEALPVALRQPVQLPGTDTQPETRGTHA